VEENAVVREWRGDLVAMYATSRGGAPRRTGGVPDGEGGRGQETERVTLRLPSPVPPVKLWKRTRAVEQPQGRSARNDS
jgi:hypothetical protein